MENFLSISLKLNFTRNTFGGYGLTIVLLDPVYVPLKLNFIRNTFGGYGLTIVLLDPVYVPLILNFTRNTFGGYGLTIVLLDPVYVPLKLNFTLNTFGGYGLTIVLFDPVYVPLGRALHGALVRQRHHGRRGTQHRGRRRPQSVPSAPVHSAVVFTGLPGRSALPATADSHQDCSRIVHGTYILTSCDSFASRSVYLLRPACAVSSELPGK